MKNRASYTLEIFKLFFHVFIILVIIAFIIFLTFILSSSVFFNHFRYHFFIIVFIICLYIFFNHFFIIVFIIFLNHVSSFFLPVVQKKSKKWKKYNFPRVFFICLIIFFIFLSFFNHFCFQWWNWWKMIKNDEKWLKQMIKKNDKKNEKNDKKWKTWKKNEENCNFPKNEKLQFSSSFLHFFHFFSLFSFVFAFFYFIFQLFIIFHYFCFQWCKNCPKNKKLQFSSSCFHFFIIFYHFLNHFCFQWWNWWKMIKQWCNDCKYPWRETVCLLRIFCLQQCKCSACSHVSDVKFQWVHAWSVDLSGAFIRHFLRKCAFETFYAEVLYLTEYLQTCEVTPSGPRHFAFGHAGMYAIDWKRPGVSRRQLRAALSLAQSSGVWSRIWSFFGPVNYPPTTRGKGVAGGLGEPYFDGNVPGIDYLGAKKELQDMWKVILPIDFHIFQRGWNHQPVYVYVVMAKRNGILLLQKNSWDWSIYF